MTNTDELKFVVAAANQIAYRNIELRRFLLRLTDPDDLGHAVTPEVRHLAHQLATSQDTEQ